MRNKKNRFLSLLLAAVLVLCMIPAVAFAAEEKAAYEGEVITFLKADGGAFGMLAPQKGSYWYIDGENVVIHIIPKNTTTYGWIHLGTIDDSRLTDQNADLSELKDYEIKSTGIDITLPAADLCGKQTAVAPIKNTFGKGSWTSAEQYYLAVPEASVYEAGKEAAADVDETINAIGEVTLKSEEAITKAREAYEALSDSQKQLVTKYAVLDAAEASLKVLKGEAAAAIEKFTYTGESVKFIKNDDAQSTFGMFTAQAGTTCKLEDGKVVIHYVPKNTTTYNSMHLGTIYDEELSKDITFNEDGSFDLELDAKEYAGYASPVAPIKVAYGKGSWTTSDQYYLAVPSEEILKAQADAEAAAEVDAKIEAIGEVDLTSEADITAAREAYDALTDAQKALVKEENVKALEAAEAKLAELKQNASDAELAAAVEEKIEAIGEVTLDSESAITAARKAYDALTEDQKALVKEENVKALEAAEAKLAELKAAAEEPEEPETPAAAEDIELTVTNTTGMFKVVKAVIRKAADGSKTLVFSLNGSSYEYLFKGTYEEASANGMDKTKWIKGQTNADGKLEFQMPLSDGEKYIPVVSISNTYLKKAEAGENPIERAFYPRQFEIDETAKTLIAGDYKNSAELKITNNVKMFKPESATLTTVGGPNSNGYKKILDLKMGSDSFDKAYIGRASESAGAKIVDIKDRVFTFTLLWMETAGDLDSITDLMAEPFIVSFHSVKNDTYYERQFTVSEKNGTLVIDAAPEEEKEQVILVSITDKDNKNVTFTKKALAKADELTKPVAVEKNPNVRAEDEIDILWQKDITVPEGTAFPVTLNFEVSDVESGQQLYVYHYENGEWKLVGTGLNGKVSAKVESCSPFAVASKNAKASPQTGDSSVMIWSALAVVAVATAAGIVISRKRREN